MAYEELLAKHNFVPMNHEKPNWFDVEEADVYDREGKRVPGYKRVVRCDTGDTLHVATESYTLVPFKTHFDALEDAIRKSGLPLEGMQVATDMADNGARIFRQYLFPEARAEVGGHTLAMRIVTWDSYNGTSSYIGKTGFFDWVCANQSVIGRHLMDFRAKHTGNMEIKVEKAIQELADCGPRFFQHCERMIKWVNAKVSAVDASELVAAMPQSSKSLTDELTSAYARSMGTNLWDLHSTLSFWATHGCPPKTQADRQKRVSDLVEGKDWQLAERVA